MSHPIPDDLVRLQREWTATYRRLADQPGRTVLRRRLLRLSVELHFHPRLRTATARAALRRRAQGEP
ncbi:MULTISPECIES: hypothetical protein [Streptomyces]